MSDTKPERLRTNVEDESRDVFTRASPILLASVVLLFIAARLWRLTSSCLWFDEIFSVHAARHDWAGMFRFVAADLIHPPLFYVLLKIWMALGGESLLWLRLFPALSAVACIAPFVLLCRELKLTAAQTNLALLLMAANGYLIKYAQEVRMYSLLLFFTLVSLWLFVRFVKADDKTAGNRKLLLALFVVNLLVVYTHYYGWLVVSTEAIFLLIAGRRKLRGFSIVLGAIALGFAPWAYAVAHVARVGQGLQQNIGWVSRPGLSDVAQFLVLLNEPFYFRQSSDELLYARLSAPLGLLLFGLSILFLLWRIFGERASKRNPQDASKQISLDAGAGLLFGLLVFILLPVLSALFLSWLLPQSVWGTRHLIIVAAPYLLLAALALGRLRPLWLKAVALVVLGGWLAFAGLSLLVRRPRAYIWCSWERLIAQLIQSQHATKDAATDEATTDNIYAFEELVAYHLWFALDSSGKKNFKVTIIKNVPGIAEDPAYFLPRAFDEVKTGDLSAATAQERFWVAFRDVELNEQHPPLKILKERGYRITNILEESAQGQRAFLIELRR